MGLGCAQGVYSVFVPDNEDGTSGIPHNSFVKVYLVLRDGSHVYRVPAWIRYATCVAFGFGDTLEAGTQAGLYGPPSPPPPTSPPPTLASPCTACCAPSCIA